MSDPLQPVDDIHQDVFAARLRHAVTACGGSSALARRIGRSEGAIRKWLRGDSEPNVSDLRSICRATGASASWLVTGEGDSRLWPVGVREPSASYAPDRTVAADLLEQVLVSIEEVSHASGSEIAANKKSAIAVTLYSLSK